MDIVPSFPWWYSVLPLVIIGVVIFGIIFLIMIGIFIGRRFTLKVRSGGAVALTLASILLLSGVWCMFFSPPVISNETKDNFSTSISIENQSSWSYSFDISKGDFIDGSTNGYRPMYENKTPIQDKLYFNVKIYDSDNDIVWSRNRVSYVYFNLRAPKTGTYRIEVQNLNALILDCNVQFTIRGEVTYRPLDAAGQWLSLISIPIFGLGIWASGILTKTKRENTT